MRTPLIFAYGVLSYLISLGSFVYFSLWVTDHVLPKTVDSAPVADATTSFAVNTVLLTSFCFAHSLLARTSVKRLCRHLLPRYAERSTYCLLFGLLLVGLCALWQPVPHIVWKIASPAGKSVIYGLFFLFWGLHFWALFWIHHNEFFGLRQTWLAAHGREYVPPPAMAARSYWASHLLLVVSLILIPWATPTMSAGHLYFCIFLTVYDILGAWFSSRDMAEAVPPV